MIVLQDELKSFNKRIIDTNKDALDRKYGADEALRAAGANLNSYELGDMYYNNALDLAGDNNISKAIELLEKSLEYNDKDTESLNLLGIFHYMFCNFNKANVNWNKSLKVNNLNNRASYFIESLNSDKFKSFIEYYNLSIKYIERFQYKDAIELLLEINKTNKDLIEPYALLGNCYYALQQYDLGKQYFNKALSMDIDNIKYLKYLNKINASVPLKAKTKTKDHNFNFKIAAAVFAMLVIVAGLAFYRNYNKNIKKLALELEKSKLEYSKLQDKLDKEKEESAFNSDKVGPDKEPPSEENKVTGEDDKSEDLNEEDDKDDQEEETAEEDNKEEKEETPSEELNFSGTEAEIFEEAMKAYKSEKYKEAIDRLQFLIKQGSNGDLVAESTYFIAVLFEKEKNYDKAGEYYNSYIKQYRERSYYDDSLYNYGLMLHEKGDIEASKKILKKLKKDEPDSEFVNSKVKAILDK